MADFDREALVAKTQKRSTPTIFWILVAALPLMGAAAGLAFTVLPSGSAASTQAADATDVAPAPDAAKSLMAAADAEGWDYSARAEVQRYMMTLTTLRTCAKGGLHEHYMKALSTYQKSNESKLEQLNQLASNEPNEHDLSAFTKEIPTDPAEIMLQGFTGQIAVNALQRQTQFGAMLKDIERQTEGYLGTSPIAADCTAFRNEVIRGEHNPSLPPVE